MSLIFLKRSILVTLYNVLKKRDINKFKFIIIRKTKIIVDISKITNKLYNRIDIVLNIL